MARPPGGAAAVTAGSAGMPPSVRRGARATLGEPGRLALSEVSAYILQNCPTSRCHLRRGQVLYRKGEPAADAAIVIDGWLFLHQLLRDGRRQILDFMLPGALVGFQPDRGQPRHHFACSLTDVVLFAVSIKSLLDLAQRDPGLGVRLAESGTRAAAAAYNRLTSIGCHSAKERIAYLMIELYCRARQTRPAVRGESVPLPLTQEHIADTLGLSPVHVNRTLVELRAEGLIDLRRQVLTILDPDAVAELAGFDPATDGTALGFSDDGGAARLF